MYINTDLICSGTMNLDMVLGSSLDLVFTLVLGDPAGHSDLCVLSNNMILEYQHGLRTRLKL